MTTVAEKGFSDVGLRTLDDRRPYLALAIETFRCITCEAESLACEQALRVTGAGVEGAAQSNPAPVPRRACSQATESSVKIHVT